MNAHLLLMAGLHHTVWERKGTGLSHPPTPHSLIFQSGQSSEPIINKESGREVNQGQWVWMWPVQQRISVSELNRPTVAPRGTAGGSHIESLKTRITLMGCFSTWGAMWMRFKYRTDTCLCKTRASVKDNLRSWAFFGQVFAGQQHQKKIKHGCYIYHSNMQRISF